MRYSAKIKLLIQHLSVREIALYIGCHQQTVYQWSAKEGIKPRKPFREAIDSLWSKFYSAVEHCEYDMEVKDVATRSSAKKGRRDGAMAQ